MIFKKTLVLFSVECVNIFDWQILALYESFKNMKNANLVRLLACDNYDDYNDPVKNLVETYVHENMRNSKKVNEKGYPSYNKPYGLSQFIKNVSGYEYVMVLDSDVVIRKDIDPYYLGVKPGFVYTIPCPHLFGVETNFKKRFLVTDNPTDKVGGVQIFHISDAEKISPLWFEYTKKVRDFLKEKPDTYLEETFKNYNLATSYEKNQAKWHAEMYGYVFAASHLDIKHIISDSFLLHAGYYPFLQKQPHITHYGIEFEVGNIVFRKSSKENLLISDCKISLFDNTNINSNTTKKDYIAVETIDYLNTGLCNYYKNNCNYVCPDDLMQKIDNDIKYIKFSWHCSDQHQDCSIWKEKGECENNPEFMNNVCTESCEKCSIEKHNYYPYFSLIFIMILFGLKFIVKKKKKEVQHVV
tara:strand:- start:1864 stop:3102 length:1239 start_codon:yes stop_codon:yes gene_type:complete